MQAKFDSRKIGKGRLISCKNCPPRGQGSGCDHEIMSIPGPALLPDKDKELRVGVGDLQVVVDHRNVRENVVKKLLPAYPVGGVLSINSKVISNLVYGSLTPLASWISLVVLVGLFAVFSISQAARRRSRGLSAPPLSITILKIVITAAAGAALVWICGYNRGTALVVEEGVPWVVPFVIAVIVGLSFLLGRTRFGRYIYAIGASPKAARRAGINVAWIRTFAFTSSVCLGGQSFTSRALGRSTSAMTAVLMSFTR